MNNFAYQNNCNRQGNNLNDCKNNEIYTDYLIKKDYPNNRYNTFIQPIVSSQQLTNDERFGGAFLVPFLTGAVISAPFWYLGAQNKANQMYQQQMSYQYNNPYQTYYPNYYPYNYSGNR